MRRNLADVKQILEAKYNVACDRDLLQNIFRYLKEKTIRLEKAYKKNHYKSLKKKIEKLQSHTKFISQLIKTANDLLKPSRYFKLRSVFDFFVSGIRVLQKNYNVFEHKFRGVYEICNQMVANATELKKLTAL
ncbi:MAG: hypothetical protein PHP62_00395 [Candidatus Moranbacteria bacterium]|nr:hypothetical protein [Candidatus Moranbacteria bacterium]